MQYRSEVVDVVESPLVQIATVAERMPGALKLCYGESDMPTPPFICRAAYDASRTDRAQLRRALSALPLLYPTDETWSMLDRWVDQAAEA